MGRRMEMLKCGRILVEARTLIERNRRPTSTRGDQLFVDQTTNVQNEATQHYETLKLVHALLSVVGWGVILPMAIVPDTTTPDDDEEEEERQRNGNGIRSLVLYRSKSRMVFHVVGFTLGAAGWATGMYVTMDTSHDGRRGGPSDLVAAHRCVGIIVFTIATLNLLLRLGASPVLHETHGSNVAQYLNPSIALGPLWLCLYTLLYYALGALTIFLVDLNLYFGNDLLPLAGTQPSTRLTFLSVQCLLLLSKIVASFCRRRRRPSAAPIPDPETPHHPNALPPP